MQIWCHFILAPLYLNFCISHRWHRSQCQSRSRRRLFSWVAQWNMQRNFHVGNQQFLACYIFQHQQLRQYGGVTSTTHTHTHTHTLKERHTYKLALCCRVCSSSVGLKEQWMAQPSASTTRKIASEAYKILFSNARRHTKLWSWQPGDGEMAESCQPKMLLKSRKIVWNCSWLLTAIRGLLGLNLNPS